MKNLLFSVMLLFAISLNAQDRLFTYTYQSSVLNKGQKEIEIWTTMMNSREKFYRAFDHSLEFEVGLGSKIQTSFYLNYGYSKAIVNTNNQESIENSNSNSFSNEWKLKMTDPVIHPFGSALYFEYTLATDEVEIESKLIFDKQIGKTVQAFNIVGEFAYIKEFESKGALIEIKKEKEFNFELNYAIAYKVNSNLSLGLEFFNKNQYVSNGLIFSVFSAGPSLSYNFEGFWVNLSCLPQITDFKTGKQELLNNEKIQTRLIFSYVL
ncbi:MAG: hypothetical protein ACOYO1_05950 [Bacteroidales bacterium]